MAAAAASERAETPPDARNSAREAWLSAGVAAALALAHALGTWGHVTVFWGDYGYIMDLLARAAGGNMPYRDVHWPYPPLSIWVMSGLLRMLGTDMAQIWIATALIYTVLVALYVWYVHLTAPAGTQVLVAATGVLLFVALGNLGGAPLPMGSYSSPGPVGFAVLLAGWCMALRYDRTQRAAWAAAASACAGLAVLSKHDFWIAAAVVVLFCGVLLRQRRGLAPAIWFAALPSVLVTLAGWTVIAVTTHPGMVVEMLGGFGYVNQQAWRGAPTLEVITIHVMALAFLAGLLTLGLALLRPASGARWRWPALCALVLVAAIGVWFAQAARIAQQVATSGLSDTPTPLESAFALSGDGLRAWLVTSVRTFVAHAARHPLPLLLPVLCLVTLLAGRPRAVSSEARSRMAWLFVFCLALRARRQFEFTEWFVVLAEVPAYAALAAAWLRGEGRSLLPLRMVLAGLLLWGAVAYHEYGRGAFTRRGVHPRQWTARGYIRAGPDSGGVRRVVDALNTIDPTGQRPLFAYGYTNGFNYFTGRSYPNGAPIGFRSTSTASPELTVRAVLTSVPSSLVIDGPFWDDMMFPVPGLFLLRWDRPFEQPALVRQMRVDFAPISAACPQVHRLGTGPRAFTIHDCPRPPAATAAH